MSAPPSALQSRPDPLGPFVMAAVIGHLVAPLALVALQSLGLLLWGAPEPLIDPDDVIEIAMVSLPKSEDVVPTRATRKPVPKAPEPVAKPLESKPPQRVSDLVIEKPKPEPAAPAVKDDSQRKMADLMQELSMDELLDDLDADEGTVDRDASSPDGSPDAPPSAIVGASAGDPETARYIAQLSELFMSHFRPLPVLKGKGLVAKVLVNVDSTGRVTARRVETTSGNPSWDRAAISAVDAVGTVPAPPEKYRGNPFDYRIIFEER